MPNNSIKTPATDAVKALHLFLLGSEDDETLPAAAVERELHRAQVDIAKMAEDVRKRISQAQNRVRLAAIAERTKDVSEEILRSFDLGPAVEELRRQVTQAIERISSLQPEAAVVFHRKLEQSTDEDLASLLADLKELEGRANEDKAESG